MRTGTEVDITNTEKQLAGGTRVRLGAVAGEAAALGTSRDLGASRRVRRLVVAGMLGALTVVLQMTPVGRIPTPLGIAATIMHIPAILGGCLEGPWVGAGVGLIFGLFSFLYPSAALLKDPLVSVVPRVAIGVAAWAVYAAVARAPRAARLAPAVAAIAGTATNTVGVLGIAVLRGYLNVKAASSIAALHGTVEAVLAAVVASLIVPAIHRVRSH